MIVINHKDLRILLALASMANDLNGEQLNQKGFKEEAGEKEYDIMLSEHGQAVAICRRLNLQMQLDVLTSDYIEEVLEHEDPETIDNTRERDRVLDLARYIRDRPHF